MKHNRSHKVLKPTKRERAIALALQELERDWPKNLLLFSWSGSLTLIRISTDHFKEGDERVYREKMLAGDLGFTFPGIRNDGGCP